MNEIFEMLASTGTSMVLSGTEDDKKFNLTVERAVERAEHGGYVMHVKHGRKMATMEVIGKRSDDQLVRHYIRPAIRALKGLPPKFDDQGLKI